MCLLQKNKQKKTTCQLLRCSSSSTFITETGWTAIVAAAQLSGVSFKFLIWYQPFARSVEFREDANAEPKTMPCLSTVTLLFRVQNLWLRCSKNIGEGRFQRCYVAKLCLLMEPRSHPSLCSSPRCSVSVVQASRISSFFMPWCYCLEDILHSPLPPVFRSPSNIHACSILGLKIQFPPLFLC